MRARIAMVNNDSSSLVRFSNFSEDFRPINCGVPVRIQRPTKIKWNSRHRTSFAKATGHHLLRSDFFTNKFRWIWLGFKDPQGGLLFSFGLIRIAPWLNYWKIFTTFNNIWCFCFRFDFWFSVWHESWCTDLTADEFINLFINFINKTIMVSCVWNIKP